MIGWQELVLILAILLFVFGPTKLPQIARELGKAVREFNKARSGITEAVQSPLPVENKNRDKLFSDIAKTLNINTKGKTNEQLTREIIMKIEHREKASDTNSAKR